MKTRHGFGRSAVLALASMGALCVGAGAQSASAASISFSDNFNSGASSEWSNSVGGWTTSDGAYLPSVPNNVPQAYSLLPYDLTDFNFSVEDVSVGDSGILLRTNASDTSGVLLVLGGDGYGQGNRGGGAGNSLYFQIYQNGVYSGQMDAVNNVFVPGSNANISVQVVGDTYSVDVDGNFVTSLTSNVVSNGQVGLYDDQPNTTTGSGFGAPSAFDNVTLSGSTISAAPEPAAWLLMIAGLGGVGLMLRRAKTTVTFRSKADAVV